MRARFGLITAAGLAAGLCLSAADAAAQDVRYGVKGGLNVSRIVFTADGVAVSPGSRGGLVIGGFMEGPLQLPGWSILTEALFSMKGSALDIEGDGEGDDLDQKVRLTYFEVPVLARAALTGPRNSSVHLYAGPAFALKLSESVSPDDEDAPEDDVFKPFDVGLTFGGSLEIRGVLVDLRYSLGLLNIADEDDFDPALRARNRTFSVLVGWRLR